MSERSGMEEEGREQPPPPVDEEGSGLLEPAGVARVPGDGSDRGDSFTKNAGSDGSAEEKGEGKVRHDWIGVSGSERRTLGPRAKTWQGDSWKSCTAAFLSSGAVSVKVSWCLLFS